MSIKILIYLYSLFFTVVSLTSYKKGIYLLWVSVLFIPWLVLANRIFGGIQLIEVLICVSLTSQFLSKDNNHFPKYLYMHKEAILVYLFVALCVILFSTVVPLPKQFTSLRRESLFILFGIQTFFLVKKESLSSNILLKIVCAAVIFNFIYCLVFEIIMRFNPAATTLGVLLGIDEDFSVTDMIDSERGIMGFRLQSIYAHSLSLGQYMMLIFPLFFIKNKIKFKFIYIALILFLIVLTGTRSAIFPVTLSLIFFMITQTNKTLFKNTLYVLVALLFLIIFIPNKSIEKYENLMFTYVQFWNDKRQISENVKGSSMEMRTKQFKYALKEIDKSPVFGLGYGYRDYWINKYRQGHPTLHGFESVFLLQLVERGWVGLIMYFVIIYFLYSQLSKRIKQKTVLIMIFVSFIISIIMTGVRPASLLILCLAGSIANGMSPKKLTILSERIKKEY